tara:strand:- start:12672 stop:13367 length:696 start_codon:yes stop_codon:yes gene_type:complete
MPMSIPTLNDILGQYGASIQNLQDPGEQYGYGQNTKYGKYFSNYNIDQFDQARESLGQLQEGLLSGVRDQYSQSFTDLQGATAGKMGESFGQQAKSGFSGAGSSDRYRQELNQAGQDKLGSLSTQRTSSLTGIEETIGSKYGQLAGTIGSFLRGSAQMGLGITQADPTGGINPADNSTIADNTFIVNMRSQLSEGQRDIFDDFLEQLGGSPSIGQVKQIFQSSQSGYGYGA